MSELRKTAVREKTLLLAMKVYVDSSAHFDARLRSVKNIVDPLAATQVPSSAAPQLIANEEALTRPITLACSPYNSFACG
jgi:hypothetical protein